VAIKEYQHGNAIIRVTRPDLTEAEQAKQESYISIALQQFGKAMEEAKAERGVTV